MRRGLGFHARRSPGVFNPASLFLGGTVQGAWFDPSDATTLFSDRAGTTPCGTPGGGSVVPVGAMLDKRAAGYSVFLDGSNDNLQTPNSAAFQFGTGDFTVEGWIYVTGALSGYRIIAQCAVNNSWATGWTFTVKNDQLNLWLNGSDIANSAAGSITANTWIHVAATRSGTNVRLWVNGSSVATATNSDNLVPTRAMSIGDQDSTAYGYPFQGYLSNIRIVKGTAVYTGNFTPSGPLSPITGTSLLTCGTSWTGNPAITKNGDARVDGLNPFTASPVGNHAIAANDTTARPELRARVNLLEYSEQFDNAYWTKGSASISANTSATTDPLGGNNADKLIEAANNAAHFVERNMGVLTGTFTASIYAKAAERTWLHVQLYPLVDGRAWFDLANGVLGTVDPTVTATITPAGNGWYRCTVSRNTGNTTFVDFYTSTGNNVSSYLGDGTSGIYIWGADLRPANIGTAMPAYQRISDANTYDAVGFPRYLAFNGTSSAMSTPGNVNLSGTDKVTVFAGVRKNDNTNINQLVEFSSDVSNPANAGAFSMPTNPSATGQWAAYLRGSTGLVSAIASGTAAPITTVNTALYDIALSADEARLRINGTQVATSGASSAGTGNFGSYPLFIGARNNASVFFTGNLYSLIVVGSAVSAGQISATEQWIAQRTGITI